MLYEYYFWKKNISTWQLVLFILQLLWKKSILNVQNQVQIIHAGETQQYHQNTKKIEEEWQETDS